MSTTSPRTAPPRGTTFRAALILAAAGTVLTGCGQATEPVASHRSSDPAAGLPSAAGLPTAAGAPATTSPAPAGPAQAPAVTPSSGAEASPVTARPAAPTLSSAPIVAPVVVTPDDLADIDRSLADIDTQLNDAGKDAATPEGDLG